MLVPGKGLEFMGFIDGKYVACDITPPFHALDRHHKSIIAFITAGPQPGLSTFQYNPSGSYYNWSVLES